MTLTRIIPAVTLLALGCAPHIVGDYGNIFSASTAQDGSEEKQAAEVFFDSSQYTFTRNGSTNIATPSTAGSTLTSCSASPPLPEGLLLNTTTCAITGTPTAITPLTSYTITPFSTSGPGKSSVIKIEVVNSVPRIAYSASSFNFELRSPSTTQTPTNSGGAITNCTVVPALPAGLALSAVDCTISGSPSVAAAANNYTIVASNEMGSAQAVILQITVDNIIPEISFADSSYVFNVGSISVTDVPSSAGGAITSCSVAPALPGGLTIAQTTCRISGTPNAVTPRQTFVVTPHNSAGNGNPVTIDLEVQNIAPNIQFSSNSYQFSFLALATTEVPENSGGAITDCTVTPALSPGLVISATTCEISGTPTSLSGSITYSVTASNEKGTTSRSISIAVSNVVPKITYSTTTFVFNLYSASTTGTPDSSSGGAITGCTISPSLPAGLTIHPLLCTISGTPTELKSQTEYTVTPSNDIGSGVARTITIAVDNVVPNISFAQGSYAFNLLSNSASDLPTNSGGEITNCTVSPALPAGLNISPTTCRISGIPEEVSSSATYTITPSNEKGSGTPRSISLQIANVVPEISFNASVYSFDLFTASNTGIPANSGGAITGCTVNPSLPEGIAIEMSTCRISGSPSVVSGATDYTITPSNEIGSGVARIVNIRVNNVAPNISFSSGTYSFTLYQASDTGTPTNTGGAINACTITPALVAGLSYSETSCRISGVPTELLTATPFTVTPSNPVGSGPARQITLSVDNVVPNIAFSSESYSFNLNTASDTGVPTNTGGAITGCIVSPALPAGLSINAGSCRISGTPTILSGATLYTVTPGNSVGSGTAQNITISVNNVVPNITFVPGNYSFVLGAASDTGVPANSGGAITGCTVSPALPAGLSINTGSCRISGTPSVVSGATAYTVTPSNGVGSGAARTVTITVNNIVPNIAFSSGTYSFNLNAASDTGTPTNSGGAITGCTVSPALPAGLSINTGSCRISGTPSVVSGATVYTVTPSNGVGSGTARTVTITVNNSVPNITFSSGTYSFDVNAASDTGTPTNSGGAITGCTVSPALPAGLSINTGTCRISGTPTAAQAAAAYTITPSNAAGSGTPVTIDIAIVGGGCFVAGTPVTMANGEQRLIENIQVGDHVLAMDPISGQPVAGRVNMVMSSREVPETLNLLFATEDHEWLEVKTTPRHRFIFGNYFTSVPADTLRSGDEVFIHRNTGEMTKAVLVSSVRINETVKVYNFEVEQFHTYFVNSVLVHNPKNCFIPETLISMGNGASIRIDQVKKGDLVMTFDSERGRIVSRKVTNVVLFDNKVAVNLLFKTEKGFVSVKPGLHHPFFVENLGTVVEAKDMTLGSRVFVQGNAGLTIGTLVAVENADKYDTMYDLEIEGSDNFFANGILVLDARL